MGTKKMTRQELLKKLRAIKYAATLTVLSAEEGLEIRYYKSAGTCIEWIGYDDWHYYCLRVPAQKKWDNIQKKLSDGTLMAKDIEHTDFAILYHTVPHHKTTIVRTFLSGLNGLSCKPGDKLYCDANEFDAPIFYPVFDDMTNTLAAKDPSVDTKWDEFSVSELQEYWDEFDSDGVPCIVLNPKPDYED